MLPNGDPFPGNFVAKRASSKTRLVLKEALEKPAFRLVFPVNLTEVLEKPQTSTLLFLFALYEGHSRTGRNNGAK